MKKNIKFKDISFIIVSYRSDSVINSCLNALPEESPKIIIENSNNKNLKLNLENNYSNLNCILSKKNLGYGVANNIGVRNSNTEYIFIINPDVTSIYDGTIRFKNIVEVTTDSILCDNITYELVGTGNEVTLGNTWSPGTPYTDIISGIKPTYKG